MEPHCKIQTPIRWILGGKPGKRTFKKSSKLALKKLKKKRFLKFTTKRKLLKSYSRQLNPR